MNRHVALDRKLAALQECDGYRKWYSLDDERVCILCERPITGRMIEVWESGRGVYHLHCPTPGCPGTPRHWFYHGATQSLRTRVIKSRAPIASYGRSYA